MGRHFAFVGKLLDRWSRQKETEVRQMTGRNTAGQRIAGFSKSERVDSKLFLSALVPFVPVMASDQLGWSRGTLWHAWFGVSVVWAMSIIGLGLVVYWPSFRRVFPQEALVSAFHPLWTFAAVAERFST
jgi:hypothetical protein